MEASCLKCHHQVEDLVRDGSRIEAEKLVKGFRAGEPIDKQAYSELNDMLKDDGGASILADLKEKHKKMDAKQNVSKT